MTNPVGPRHERRRRLLLVVLTLVVLVAVLAVVVHRGAGPTAPESAGASSAGLPGLQDGPAPWPPEYDHLRARLDRLGLPAAGDAFSIRTHLAVFVDGQRVAVPTNVGVSALSGLQAPLHTHDSSGVVYVESVAPSATLTLGAFFDVWGVVLTPEQLGGYRRDGVRTVQVYVNGTLIDQGRDHQLIDHDDLVVVYGTAGSGPTSNPYRWSTG